ncbi:hypothetical protein BH10BAC5_BH10BAC5_22240 [soil metagenome]
MKEFNELEDKKINRKKFFVYFASFAAGAYALTKLPANFIRSKLNEGSKLVSFSENPLSVKRNSSRKNG